MPSTSSDLIAASDISDESSGGHGESKSKTSITNLPSEILLMILSLLSVKDAVVISSVCKNWRFLWRGLTHLNFISSVSSKQVEQVNSVIRSYNNPVVHEFQIYFGIGNINQRNIDEWLQFAANKKVEILELHININVLDIALSNARVVELVHLKKLCLTDIAVRDADLEELLKGSPHLESISIDGSRFLTHIRVGGRRLNLKHFKITFCVNLRSLYISDFELESFTYKGKPIDLQLANLPTLKESNISGLFRLENVFNKISSCLSSLQAVTFTIYHPKKTKLDKIPQLPNVQKLTLIMGAEEDDCLLECASIAEAYPILETFIVELLWFSGINSRSRKAMRVVTDHPFEKLKLFKFLGYCSRVSDFELAAYVIDNVVALKKIVIDSRVPGVNLTAQKDLLKMKKVARSSAARQLKRIVQKPSGIKLVIL
ncbi:F-box/LRR-repeat protein At3g26922-like [Bidens hawaiensis]|uniref:F-box/LRR-repeat protein At3g26922-like n=1 Tax=Bidens hawaiensis TaxID=980011 RepID=UPI00404B0117